MGLDQTKVAARFLSPFLLAVWVLLLSAGSRVDAATVTWSSIQTITSNLNIQNRNAIIVARDYGNAVSNVNVAVGASTVTFVPAFTPFNSTSGFGAIFFDPTGTTVAPDFESVLDSFNYSHSGVGMIRRRRVSQSE